MENLYFISSGGYDNDKFDEEESAQGFKLTNNVTGSEIKIYSGKFDLNCADDGFRSLRDITILSGEFNIKSKDDGICPKMNLFLGEKGGSDDDLKITISNSYEALEGMSVTIYSGKISCTVSDIAINASILSKEPERPRNHTHRNGTNLGNFNWTNFDLSEIEQLGIGLILIGQTSIHGVVEIILIHSIWVMIGDKERALFPMIVLL